ncbi:uncharacterized protein LOC114880114 [Osmia bicornis bicornis]|uniref:uncharacterized protein LOC114880114 n=1 Tax=Osmia bicornis bicornis TaxID=1437191 RepID=UPI001EAEBF7C|nr:uncharacterized protein LOC114880114 [Osmia bicornis bicornis]
MEHRGSDFSFSIAKVESTIIVRRKLFTVAILVFTFLNIFFSNCSIYRVLESRASLKRSLGRCSIRKEYEFFDFAEFLDIPMMAFFTTSVLMNLLLQGSLLSGVFHPPT